jgi:hypothetical protein
VHLTREEFEKAARPHLDRTVSATVGVLRSAGVTREATAGVFLVGGSSRIPLVATLLHRQLGVAPTVIDQPELVVAHGCLYAAGPVPRPAPMPVPVPPVPRPVPVPTAVPAPVWPARPVPSPLPAVHGIPPRGVLPRDFPVHLVELAIGDGVGYTARTYVAEEDGLTLPVFASEDGRLPLFRRPEHASDYAAGTDRHALTSVLHWETLAASMASAFLPLVPDNRYDLDLPSINLEREPKEWLVDLIVRAGQVAMELVEALDIEEGYALIGQGTLLDRLDDALRVVAHGSFRRGRRELSAFDRTAIAAGWQRLAEVIESRVDWRD